MWSLKRGLHFRSYKLCFKSCKKSSDCPIGPKNEPQVCMPDGSCQKRWESNHYGISNISCSNCFVTFQILSILSPNFDMYLHHRCTSDKSCPRGFVCHTDGTCQYPCSDNSDCLTTEYCQPEAKICQTLCTSNENCAEGFTCLDGTCHRPCKEQKNCLENQHCNE